MTVAGDIRKNRVNKAILVFIKAIYSDASFKNEKPDVWVA